MNVILRNSTRRMIDQSHASVEAEAFIAWPRKDGYTDYVIDCEAHPASERTRHADRRGCKLPVADSRSAVHA
jgi:hypothetical protein